MFTHVKPRELFTDTTAEGTGQVMAFPLHDSSMTRLNTALLPLVSGALGPPESGKCDVADADL